MFTDETLDEARQMEQVRKAADIAHAAGVAAEGEIDSLPGVGGGLQAAPGETHLTTTERARAFLEATGVDSLAVNVGQVHLHGRAQVRLNLERVSELKSALPVPLVLHGATSILREDLAEAIHRGVRKVNVGSILKRTFSRGDAHGEHRGGGRVQPLRSHRLGSGP